ncbi:hypothetical protein ACFXGA_27065 [Actinosynnema sp. NPDC059335]|uniref:hypothetical protein n=1 Tax=Actinosynnema sp. NPDC059335 TaxID=3346804 RepID=UPI00366B0D7B
MTTTADEPRADRSATVRLVDVLADLVHAMRTNHPGLPAIEASVGEVPARRRTGSGHAHQFTLRPLTGRHRDKDQEDAVPVFGLVIATDVLTGGSTAVLETLLHAAAHARNAAAGVGDTSREGRYHNKAFRDAARQLGLDVADPGRDGWAATTLPDTAAAPYRPQLDTLTSAIAAYGPPEPAASTTTSGGRWLAAVCGCTPHRTIRVTRGGLAVAPVVCTRCAKPFRLVEPATTTG